MVGSSITEFITGADLPMTVPPHPVPVRSLRGLVARGRYGKGSKSERLAVFLETESGRFLLRRKTGPAFADPDLDPFVGEQVTCDGFLLGNVLLAEEIRCEGRAKGGTPRTS